MNNFDWEEVETLVDRALELPPQRREAFIESQCGDNTKLKGEVTLLLESISESEGWLEDPIDYQLEFYQEIAEDVNLLSTSHSLIGKQVGSYTIKKKIGEGGMGVVYLAERTDNEFEHRVAIKIMRHARVTKENIRRFRREQGILAGLNHSGIARLYDGGITEDGFPYIVMEYVDGIPIDAYCKKHNCSLNEKLKLSEQVLEAVLHAHENLVIHRDLKPGNILVNTEGNVKILDFGISKLLEEDESMDITQTGSRVLTLRYAAPEQILEKNITTATDLYSFGIVFYELLAGQGPFNLSDLSSYEVEQLVLHEEPAKPSSKVSLGAEKKELSGDLDAIALKAIRKETDQRYRIANEFLDDLRNSRQGHPVSAREDSFSYRTRKFFRRHKQGVAFTAVILLLVIGFAGFYTWQITEERDQAQQEAQKAEEVTRFLVSLFNQSNPYFEKTTSGLNTDIGSVLNYGTAKINQDLSGQPEIQAELKSVIGEVYYQMGEFSKADSLLTKAIEIRTDLDDEPRIELANTMRLLAFSEQEKGNFNEAESLLVKSISIFEKSEHGLDNQEALLAMSRLGNLLWFNKGEYQKADSVLQRTLKFGREYLDEDDLTIAKMLNDLATLNHSQGKYDEAIPYYRDSIEMYKQEYEEHANLGIIMSNYSALLREQGKYDEAEKYQREALAIHRKITGDESIDVALGLGNLGHIYLKQKKLSQADSLLVLAQKKLKNIYGEDHAYVARTNLNIGRLFVEQGNPSKAEETLIKVLESYKKVYPEDHPRQSDPLLELGLLKLLSGNPESARNYLKKAHEIRLKGYPDESWRVAQTKSAYGFSLSQLDNYSNADSMMVEAYNQLVETRGADDNYTQQARSRLRKHYKKWGKPERVDDYTIH